MTFEMKFSQIDQCFRPKFDSYIELENPDLPVLMGIYFSENGTYFAKDEDVDGFDKVIVDVPSRYEEGYQNGYDDGNAEGIKEGYAEGYEDGVKSAPPTPTQEKSVEITKNGTNEVIADDGFALSKVTINTQVPDFTADEDAIVGRGITRYVNPRVSSVGAQSFYGCSKLKFVHFAKANSAGSNSFRGCTALTTAIFDKADAINANAFNGCSKLEILIFGASTLAKLGATTALASTPIASGSGYVYVRASLVADTRTASNWAAYANQIMPFVSTVEELANIDDATYDHACVWSGGEDLTEYYFNGTAWEVFTR